RRRGRARRAARRVVGPGGRRLSPARPARASAGSPASPWDDARESPPGSLRSGADPPSGESAQDRVALREAVTVGQRAQPVGDEGAVDEQDRLARAQKLIVEARVSNVRALHPSSSVLLRTYT